MAWLDLKILHPGSSIFPSALFLSPFIGEHVGCNRKWIKSNNNFTAAKFYRRGISNKASHIR